MGQSSLNVRPIGCLPDGRRIEAWTLCGGGGLTVEVLTYGGIVTKLLVPDGNGGDVDVVLGLSDLEAYVKGHPYFGAIVGRVAGRVTGAQFDLAGRSFRLSCNEPPNHLHGGFAGFDKQLWKATAVARADLAPSLRLDYRSCDGDEGYPGNVDVSVTYSVTNDNVFLVEADATTDQATPFSLTHHSYFNLTGEGSIAGHTLQIHADEFIGMKDDLSLSDHVERVAGTANDLRVATPLADVLPQLASGHGALYPMRKTVDAGPVKPVTIAVLTHPGSGRVLTCSTTAGYLQLYTASAFDGSIIGKTGKAYERHAGICLECEGYPNGVHRPDLGDIILRPGAPQHDTTAYAFSWL